MPNPEWELFNLLTEVRRRVRQLKALPEEPRWVAALPTEDARLARTMLEAHRAWSARAAGGQAAIAAPRRTRARRKS